MRGARGGPVGNGSRARSHRLKVVFGLFALVPILLWAAALSAHQNYFQALRLRAITHVESGERVAAPAANKHGAVSNADGDRNGPTVERVSDVGSDYKRIRTYCQLCNIITRSTSTVSDKDYM